ncbi:hypothetical protein [Novipirellula caenicola]|uniref:hypothetical protein n=1 Tax=Novipirellula caenicola TaxID=1536901 RepID=UPI0031F1073F
MTDSRRSFCSIATLASLATGDAASTIVCHQAAIGGIVEHQIGSGVRARLCFPEAVSCEYTIRNGGVSR